MDPQARMKSLGTADMVIGGALLLALIALFLPWYTVSVSIGGFGGSSSANGFNSWGWLFVLAWLAMTAYWALRIFMPDVLSTVSFPSWQVTMAGGAVMFIAGLIFLTAVPSASGTGYSAGVSFGWVIALLASIGVIVGGFLTRNPEAAASLSSRMSSMSTRVQGSMSSAGSSSAPMASSPPPAPVASEPVAPTVDDEPMPDDGSPAAG